MSARFAHPFGQPTTQVVVDSLAGDRLRVEGDEAKHLVKSLRLGPGGAFVATDGAGGVARLEVAALDRRGLDAMVVERARIEPPGLRVWLAAEAAGSRGDWLVEKAVELGAWGFRPLAVPEPGRLARWSRLARAALKQSLGAWELRIEAALPALEGARSAPPAAAWLAAPGGADPLAQELPAQGDLLLVSGPPGGFSAAEEGAWRALPGVVPVDLGPLRLRAETAALALLFAARMRTRPGRETG